VEQEPLAIETLAGDRGERTPPVPDGKAEEILAPEERDRVVEIAGDGRGRPLEGRARDADRARVLAPGQVHERQVPDEVVAEPVEVLARVDGGRQAAHALVEGGQLVEGVSQRVHRPGVPRVPRHRPLRRAHRLAAPVRLLERERVKPEDERVLAVRGQKPYRLREDLREPCQNQTK
jgi:hypothetical protein